jgi:methionyl-tRNA formyltransferase
MMHQGAGLVLGSVDLLLSGNAKLIPQDDQKASHAPKIQHPDAHINWNADVDEVHNLVRGMSPFPGAWTLLDGFEWKILTASVISNVDQRPIGHLSLDNKKLIVQAKGGELEISEVQLEGKKRMNAREFINGYKIKNWSLT